MPQVNCKICSKEFYAKPHWLKQGWGKYCSLKCSKIGRRNGEYRKCHICGKKAYKNKKALERSKSGKFFCGKSCQTKWRNSEVFSGPRHVNWKGGASVNYREILDRNNVPKICRLCGTKDERVLIVHHLDKNRTNNIPENLIRLCCNCHFLIHHYKEEEEKLMVTLV